MSIRRKEWLVILLITVFSSFVEGRQETGKKNVAIVEWTLFSAYREMREAFRAGMENYVYNEGNKVNYLQYNALGNEEKLSAIISEIENSKPDLIFSIGTYTTLALNERVKDIPIVFGLVSNPVELGIIKSWEAPGGNFTGVSSDILPDEKLSLMLALVPGMKRVGLIYTGGQTDSEINKRKFKEAAEKKGLAVVTRQLALGFCRNVFDVRQAVKQILLPPASDVPSPYLPELENGEKLDFFYALEDGNVARFISEILSVTNKYRIPVYGNDKVVYKGGLVALVGDVDKMGKQAAEMAVKILQGTVPSEISAKYVENPHLVINLRAASAIGLEIPAELRKKAAKVIR